jgi:hypothetical protein
MTSEANNLLAAPTKACDFRVSLQARCVCLPEYAVPVFDECRVAGTSGELLEQRGQWWCFKHAKAVLAHVQAGPVANRKREQWEDAIRSATKLVGDREYGIAELEEASRQKGYLSQEIESLATALEEERRGRHQTNEAYLEHRAATAAYVKGTRAAEKELKEQLANQAASVAAAVAHAQALEQQAVWRVEEEASIVESLERISGFFEGELEVREQQLGQVGKRYAEL